MSDTEVSGLEATTIRDPMLGSKVLGYELRRRIGVGGMGVVYEAEDPNIGRKAAVKVLLAEIANQPHVVDRLKAEARAANAARHRGIIDIFGFAELSDGRRAIVMEFLDGVPLDRHLAELGAAYRRMPTLEVLELLDELASILQAAHDAGVVHRDLKPSNVFLSSGPDGERMVKVLDFGIAKFDGVRTGPHTATNTVMGTPAYMSPEQATGAPASPSMDLYSLGVVAFELFTGRTPFVHESLTRMLLAHQQEQPPLPSSLAPGLPTVIDAFVVKLLEKDPRRRHQSGAEVRAELRALRKVLGDPEAAITSPQLAAAPPLPAPSTTTIAVAVGPRRAPIIALALGVLALAGLVALTFRGEEKPAEPPPPPVAVQPPPAEPPVTPTEPIKPPVEPTVAPPVEPPPEPPRPLKTPAKTASGADQHRKALLVRVRKLQKRVQRAEARAEPVSIYQQQLDALTKALQAKPDADKLEAIETSVSRLEQEIP